MPPIEIGEPKGVVLPKLDDAGPRLVLKGCLYALLHAPKPGHLLEPSLDVKVVLRRGGRGMRKDCDQGEEQNTEE